MSISRNRRRKNPDRRKLQKPARTIVWLPRELKRNIARANMERAGIEQINKRETGYEHGRLVTYKSKFQRLWMDWVNPRKARSA